MKKFLNQFKLLLILALLLSGNVHAAGEFTKPSKLQPAISGAIADPDDYNQNIAGTNKDTIVGIDVDGNYADAHVGDETLSTDGALVKDVKVRTGNYLKIYNGSGVLGNNITWDNLYLRSTQATETNQGTAEVATQAETDTGTDDTRIVTPLKLANSSLISGINDVISNENLIGRKIFTSSGTWTKPASATKIIVEVVSGGGGGGAQGITTGGFGAGGGGGGGAGGYCYKKITSGIGSTESVTIGASGVAVANSNGGNGGSSSFGSHCSASGGSGGVKGTNANGGALVAGGAGGAGGAGSNGDVMITGGTGGAGGSGGTGVATNGANGNAAGGNNGTAGAPGNGGAGGALSGNVGGGAGGGGINGGFISFGINGTGGNGPNNNGSSYGGGGAGGGGSNSVGGNGAPGIVIIWEFSS